MPPPPPSILFLLFLLAPVLLLPSVTAQDGTSNSNSSITPSDYQLSAPDMLACYNKMVATAAAYDGITSHPLTLNLSAIQEGYDVFSVILTKQFCTEAAVLVEDAVDAGVMSSSSPEEIRQLMADWSTKRRLQTVRSFALTPDADPLDEKFSGYTAESGFITFGQAACISCDITGFGACNPNSYSIFLFTWQIAKTAQWVAEEIKLALETGQKVVCLIPSVLPLQNLGCVTLTVTKEVAAAAVAITTTVFTIADAIKLSHDFVEGTLNDEKTTRVWENLKIVLGNQITESDTLDAILQGLYNVSAQLSLIDLAVVNSENAIGRLTGRIQNLVLATGDAIVATLTNAEIRMTNTLSNLILDKFSIGGVSRSGRLVVPPQASISLPVPPVDVTARRLEVTEDGQFFSEAVADRDLRDLLVSTETFLYGYGCDGNDNNNDGVVDGCTEDKFAPILRVDQVFAGALNTWYTNETALRVMAQRAADAVDDCGLATIPQPILTSNCNASSLLFTATDKCGNVASAVVPVWFDPTPPTVSFTLQPAASLLESSTPLVLTASPKLVDVGLTNLRIEDACDPFPYVQANVYADENDYNRVPPQALLLRRLDTNGALIGWKLQVFAYSTNSCDGQANPVTCDLADGRVYTVVVCAKDQAGLKTCASQSIGVSRGNPRTPPVSQGNLDLVAHHAGYLNRVPADIIASVAPSTLTVHS